MDLEEISAFERSDGQAAATMLMLDRIQCRQPPSKWYTEFLRILYINGHDDVVREMEPDFTVDCERLKQVDDITGDFDSAQDVSEESLTEYIIEARLEGFRQEIIELVSLGKIVANLSHYLLPNDYSYIAGILTRTCERSTHYRERNLIKIFTPSLQHQLDPGELTCHLLADNVINDLDKEEILRKYRNSGSIAASIALLDCMQCRLSPEEWYCAFLIALVKCGRTDLVDMVDPDFLRKSARGGEDFNVKYKDESFHMQTADFRLESAYSRILQMEHSARQEVAKLRKMYDKMESDALTEIQNVSAVLTATLLETNEKIQKMSSLDDESQMKLDRLVDNTITNVGKKTFKFAPSGDFLSCSKLGTVQRYKHRRILKIKSRSPSPCLAYRDRAYGRHMRRSSSSSGSSHSSGYIQIECAKDRCIETSNVHNIVNEDGIEKLLFISATNGLCHCQYGACACAISFKRTESNSSINSGTDTLFTSSTEQVLVDLNDTKTQNSLDSEISGAAENSNTFIYHRAIGVPDMKRDCQLSSICMLPTNELVLIDQKHTSILLYDPIFTIFKKYSMKRSTPVRVCCCENSNVFVLFRRGNVQYVILFEVRYLWKKTGKRHVNDIVPKKKLHHTCDSHICSVCCSLNKVLCVCFNCHIHISTSEGKEERVLALDFIEIKSNLFWPQFCAVDRDSIAIFIYDVYSSSIRKYIISSGECVWTITVENGEVDNIIACGERLYIAQNGKNRIQSYKQETGKLDQYFSLKENVRFPFGLACSHNQNTILVTAYNPNGSKVMKRRTPTNDIKEYITKTVLELTKQHRDDVKELTDKIDSHEKKIKSLEEDTQVHKAIISELENRIETLEITRLENNGEEKKQKTSSEKDKEMASNKFISKLETAPKQNVNPEIRDRVRRANVENPVAFSASMTSAQEQLGQGQDITFGNVITNIGNAYNNHHGTFLAPVSGTYVFYFSLHNPGARADLVVNGTVIANLFIANDQASQLVIVTLKAGDDVSVQNMQSGKLVWGSGYSTFSGFLLYEGTDVAQIVG